MLKKIKKITIVISLMLLGVMAIAETAAAETGLNVTTFGAKGDGVTNDTAAIQAALDSAKNGTKKIVFIPDGTYMIDSLVVDSNVTIQGQSRDNTVLKHIPQYTGAPIRNLNRTTGDKNITLKDFTIDGQISSPDAGGNKDNGIYMEANGDATSYSNIFVTNVKIINMKGNAIFVANGQDCRIENNIMDNVATGVEFKTRNMFTSTNNAFVNNKISNAGAGILMQPFSDTTVGKEVDAGYFKGGVISNNDIKNCKAFGIELYGNASDFTITDNTLNNCGVNNHGGIVIKYSYNNIIINNVISNSFKGIEVLGYGARASKDNVFSGNTISNSKESGIILWGNNTNNTIKENIINNNKFGINVNGDKGETVGFSKNSVISNNKVYNNINDGIAITNGQKLTIKENNCYDNNRDNTGSTKSSGIRLVSGDNNTFTKNTCTNTMYQRYGIYLVAGANNTATLNVLTGNKVNFRDDTK